MSNEVMEMLTAIENKNTVELNELLQRNAFEWYDFDERDSILDTAIVTGDVEILDALANDSQLACHFLLLKYIDNQELSHFKRIWNNHFERCLKGDMSNIVTKAFGQDDDRYIHIMYDQSTTEVRREIIFKSAELDNEDIVKWILDKGFDPNTKNFSDNGNSLLHKATEWQDLHFVNVLMKYNVDVNIEDRLRWTPLFRASRWGCVEICKVLLQNGAKVNVKNNDQETPLHVLANSYSPDIAELLIEAGCCINATNRDGHIPLYRHLKSVQGSFADTSNILIKHGSYINGPCTNRMLPLLAKLLARVDDPSRSVLKNALKAGLKKSDNSLENHIMSFSELSDIRREHYKSQSKLIFLCRITIRNYLIEVGNGTSIYPRVQRLPLPDSIKSYLMLES